MKYPYIARLKSDDTKIALFTCPETATALTDNFADINLGESDSEWDESFYTDITHEYLSNTWGVVESKEHAEFIIELAVNCDYSPSFAKRAMAEGGVNWFFFSESENELQFFENDVSDSFYESEGEKQITIPLPPKAKAEKPDFSKPPKHFDCRCNKCGGKCCAGFCDDWKIGDDALVMSSKCKISALADKHGNLAVTNEFGFNLIVNKSEVKKPKSNQELLIEELQTKLCNNNAVDNYILACDIVQGKIDGLSYTG